MSLFNALFSDTPLRPEWITSSFPIIRAIILIVLAIAAIVVVVTVLMQSHSASGGTNVISGVQETYFAQNKGSSREGRLKRLTIIAISVIAISSVVYAVMELIYSGY